MAAEKNKKLIERFLSKTIDEQNLDFIDEIISPDFVWHGGAETKRGIAGFKESVQEFLTGFPDMKVHAEQIVAEGDTVATRGYMTGTHKGTFMGMPATNKKIRIDYIDWWKIENDKCVENWLQIDAPSLMTQLGAQPAPGQAR